jgi:hypothetical protein
MKFVRIGAVTEDGMRDDNAANGLVSVSAEMLLTRGFQGCICTYPATLSLRCLYITIPINGIMADYSWFDREDFLFPLLATTNVVM